MSARTRPAVAAAILVALVASLGGLWWGNRDTSPQVGDSGHVTARVHAECVGMSVEFAGEDFSAPVEMSPEGGRGWPSAWRGQEVDGTIEITERDGEQIRGSFTADGTDVPVYATVGGTFASAACLGWPEDMAG